MSTDEKVTKDIIETLEDGQDGFASAADRLAETDAAHLAPKFREWSEQRGKFAAELRSMAASYGDNIKEDGSVAAAVHRGWMAVKDMISGSDPSGVLEAAEQGEDHAMSEYKDALANDEISANLRRTLQAQQTEVQRVHDEVKALRDGYDN